LVNHVGYSAVDGTYREGIFFCGFLNSNRHSFKENTEKIGLNVVKFGLVCVGYRARC
jgi:hypothetical protein